MSNKRYISRLELCPDCGVHPGRLHKKYCDVERCPNCGGQRLSCNCENSLPHLPWSGEWPGVAECREFGWYAKRIPGIDGYVPCDKNDIGADEDLNRLRIDAIWDKKQKRFILKNKDADLLNKKADK